MLITLITRSFAKLLIGFVFISLLSGVALISTVELIIGDEGQMVMIAKNFSAGATTAAVYLYIKWLERQSF